MKAISLFLISIFILSCSSSAEPISQDQDETSSEIYFPPINSDQWETTPASELGWNQNELQPLLDFLEENNSRSFMMLHDGKIVVEAYFNNHNSNTPWYWASAGKTLTTAMVGIAQEDGLLDINTSVSDYLGTGWTSAPLDKEALITCRNLLSMDSGLDETSSAVSPADLNYVADAGTRWAYHNVYKKLQDVIEASSNQTWDNYFNTALRDKIGMTGIFIQNTDFNVFWSNTRSMARFGLLNYANGKWESEHIIPEPYLSEATNSSQELNQAYGYLWWLNGKSSYRLPQTQVEFNGFLIPSAPADLYAALGRDDQKIYIVPSKKLVVIRMGSAADDSNFALSNFDDELWQKINAFTN